MINSIFTRFKSIDAESNASGTGTLHTLDKKSFVSITFRDITDGASENQAVTVFIGDTTDSQRQYLATYNNQNDGGGTNENSDAGRVYPAVFEAGTVIRISRIRYKLTLNIFELE